MSNTNFDELLNAGCHFGHLTRKWNPKMAPYIFMERNDIHIIDLNKTAIMLDKASANRSLSQAVKFCLLQQRNRLRTLLLRKFLILICLM